MDKFFQKILGVLGGVAVGIIVSLFFFNIKRLWRIDLGSLPLLVLSSLLVFLVLGFFMPRYFEGHGLFFLAMLLNNEDGNDGGTTTDRKSDMAGCLVSLLYFFGWAGLIVVTFAPPGPVFSIIFIVSLVIVLFPSFARIFD